MYFEKPGFSQAHGIADISASHNETYLYRDGKGNQVQLVKSNVPTTISGIKINVDDFEEAVALFKSMGFEDRRPVTTEISFSKSIMMKSPDGMRILVTKHIKSE